MQAVFRMICDKGAVKLRNDFWKIEDFLQSPEKTYFYIASLFISHKMVNITQKMVNLMGSVSIAEMFSIHTLAKRIKEPYTSVHRHVVALQQLGAVEIQTLGKGHFIKLNLQKEITRYLLNLANYYKKQNYFKKYSILKLISKDFPFNTPLVLFGSYAKQEERQGSDIDLCAVGLMPKEEKEFKKSIRQIELIHRVEINCMFFKKDHIIEMLKSKEHNVGKEILINHIALNNEDLWHNLIGSVQDDIRI